MSKSGSGKVNLFIVGAPKCGTTAWYTYLQDHPDIFFPDIKEPHFFASDLPKMQWTSSLEQYEGLFSSAAPAKALGEASVMYLYSDRAADAIARYNPSARILIFLRDQVDFLSSLHNHYVFTFSESVESFEEAWRLSGNRPAETIPDQTDPKLLDYRAIGRFHEQVERYFDRFPASQIRVIRFDSWTGDPRKTYVEILEFLGLPDDGRTQFEPINEARSYPVKWIGKLIRHPPRILQLGMRLVRKLSGRNVLGLAERASKLVASKGNQSTFSPELREEIRRYFEQDNRDLEQMLADRSAS